MGRQRDTGGGTRAAPETHRRCGGRVRIGISKGRPHDTIEEPAGSRCIALTPSAQPVQGDIQMRSRMWMVVAAAALVALATVIIEKQRQRAEAERMAVWG